MREDIEDLIFVMRILKFRILNILMVATVVDGFFFSPSPPPPFLS